MIGANVLRLETELGRKRGGGGREEEKSNPLEWGGCAQSNKNKKEREKSSW